MRHTYVAKLLRLTLLAPETVEAVLDGREPAGMHPHDLLEPVPAAWDGQRQRFFADIESAVRHLQ